MLRTTRRPPRKSPLEKLKRTLRRLLGEIRVDDGAQLGPQRPPRVRRQGFKLF